MIKKKKTKYALKPHHPLIVLILIIHFGPQLVRFFFLNLSSAYNEAIIQMIKQLSKGSQKQKEEAQQEIIV